MLKPSSCNSSNRFSCNKKLVIKDCVGVGVNVGVGVGVSVTVGVGVLVGVSLMVGVGVKVFVGVTVDVTVGVGVGVTVDVGVGDTKILLEPTIKTFQLPFKALGGVTFVGLTSFVDT
jgi:hypothetical protein